MREMFNLIMKKDISLPLSFIAPTVLAAGSFLFSIATSYGEYKNKFEASQEKVQKLETSQQAVAQSIERSNQSIERLNATMLQLGERIKSLEVSINRAERRRE